MSNLGFIQLPRSLLKNDLYLELDCIERHMLQILLFLCCYKEKTMDDHGVLVHLKPGQYMTTEREFVDDCKRLSCQSDRPIFNKSRVHRFFLKMKKYHFSDQKVNHTKTIITIILPALCEQWKNKSEPAFESTLNQDRTRIEPQTKNDKNEEKEKKFQERLIDCEKVEEKKIVDFEPSADSVIPIAPFLFCENKGIEESREEVTNSALVPFSPFDLDPEESEKFKAHEFLDLSKFCAQKELSVSDGTLGIWLKKWSSQYIMGHLDLMYNHSGANYHERWMETALANNYVEKNKNTLSNRNYATQFLKEFKNLRMKVTKSYVVNRDNGEQYPFNLPPETFKDVLINAAQKQKEVM